MKSTSSYIPSNGWVHLGITYDIDDSEFEGLRITLSTPGPGCTASCFFPGEIRVYANAVLKDTFPGNTAPHFAGRGIHLTRMFNYGLMDFELYSRRLTQEEIEVTYAKNRLDGPRCERAIP